MDTPLAEILLSRVAGIARNANVLINENINQSEMVIFHMLTTKEQETGEKRIRLSEISRELGVSRPAVTQCVDRMVSREMLVRCSDSEDRRAVYVEITEKGREFFKAEKEKALTVIDRIIDRMGEENAKLLTELIDELRKALEEETELMKS